MPQGVPYPAELREAATRLTAEGLTLSQISRELGIPPTTIGRWLNPELDARQRSKSAEAKRRRRGTCPGCGKSIWYTSKLCAECNTAKQITNRYWTRERVIKAIQEWAKEHGEQPSASTWVRAGENHPAATAIYGQPNSVFRSWNEAIEAAGFTPRNSGPGPGNRKWSLDEARRLREEGVTDKEIGRRFGVTGGAIQIGLGPRKPPAASKKRTREQRIADLRDALNKGEPDGNRNGEGNNHD